MNNILLDPLPHEWNGYQVNTSFRIGIQAFLVRDDKELADWEKTNVILYLLFEDDDGNLREHPVGTDLESCINWFLNGWYHDRQSGGRQEKRLIDYDIDQYRIFADFMQIYAINLNTADMHFWKFMGLLWNMPYKYSSFLQVIEIRKKAITGKMGSEEKKMIREAKIVYELEQPGQEYSQEEKDKIDAYDRMMARMKHKEQ